MPHHTAPSGDGVRSRGGPAPVSGGGRRGHAPAAPGRAGTGYRGSPMAPITLQRLITQLDKLKPEADAARLKTHDYARWLTRMIRRLRERSLDADRAAATVALAEALKRGAIPAPMEAHAHKRPGLARSRG